MPTYEYACQACDHTFEEFQSITASALRKCPSCGKNKLKRLIGTGAGIIFKGGGFYETDYRSDSYKKAEKAEKDSSSPKTDSSAKSDSTTKSEASTTANSSADSASKPAKAKAESKPAKPGSKAKK